MFIKALLVVALLLQWGGYRQETPQNTDTRYSFPRRVWDRKSVGVAISAQSGVAADFRTGKILWGKQPHKVRPIASITKLITLLVWLEDAPEWKKQVVMQQADRLDQGGNRHLYVGDRVLVEQLFNAALVASDNEAVMALIRSSGYNSEEFVKKMNQWLAARNFAVTRVVDPTGLSPLNVSTAREVADLLRLAFENTAVRDALARETYRFTVTNTRRRVYLENTNALLGNFVGVEVGKTGYIEEAGYNLAVLGSAPAGQKIIAVVLGSETLADRFQDAKAVLFWVKENYTWE